MATNNDSVFAGVHDVPEGSTFVWLGGDNTETYDAEGNLVDSHPITDEEKEHLGYLRMSETEAKEAGKEEEWLDHHEVIGNSPTEKYSSFEDAYKAGEGEEWYKEYTKGREHAESYESYVQRRMSSSGNVATDGASDVLLYENWRNDNEHGTWAGYLNYLKSKGVDTEKLETVYEDGTGKVFSSTVEELEPDTSNTGFESEVIEDVIRRLGAAADILEAPLQSAKTIAEQYETLNEDLRNKLNGEIESGLELQIEIERTINFMHSFTLDFKFDLKKILDGIHAADSGTPPSGEEPPIPPGVEPGGGSTGSHVSSSEGSSSDVDIGEITGTDNMPDVFIESAVVGTLTFSTIVPLFDELGKPSTIQSSLTGEYDVVGIFQHEGKYYYRIYDKNLKKFYFAEIDNNSNFTTDYAEVLKMNEDAMMLSSPDIGQNVLTKMTDINEVYFVNGTLPGEGDSANITFANILDGMDGKNYYVPLSDSVEMVTLDVFKAGLLGDTTIQDTNMDVSNNVG